MLYFILGLAAGAIILGLALYTQTHKIQLRWYEWLIAIAAILLAILAVQNFDGSLQEFETGAAWFLLAMFGLPAVILAGIDAFLVRRHKPIAVPPAKS